jgi:UDP-glucose 4-epimerase
MYSKVVYEVYGLPTVSLRYFNIFGPRQDPHSQYAAVIPIFILKLLGGEQPVVYGDGEQSRDFTYVDNAVQANLLAARSGGADGKVINVCCGARFTLNQLLDRLRHLMDVDVAASYMDPRPGDILHSMGDSSLGREVLGYQPEVTFDEGLKRTVEWFRHSSGALRS